MTTFGPFYPSNVASQPYPDGASPVAWSVSGGLASVSLPAEGVSQYLVASGYSPTGIVGTARKVRIEVARGSMDGFNDSDYAILDGSTPLETSVNGNEFSADDPASIAALSLRFAIYAESGGSKSVTAFPMYVEAD